MQNSKVVDTSLEAWSKVKGELNNRQNAVLDAIQYIIYTKNTFPTNLEISHYMGIPINCITPRTNELHKLGRLFLNDKRLCKITGNLARTWRI